MKALLLIMLSFFSLHAQSVQWTRLFGGTEDDGGQSLIYTTDGSVVMAGFQSSNSRKDVLLMKLNTSGTELWSRIYNLHLNDIARSVKQTTDGGYIIAGMTEVTPQVFDPFLIKTDNQGFVQWQMQYDYGFGDDDRAHAVYQTFDGGYIIAGQTWIMHGAFGNYDMYIIKTDAAGNVQWKKIFFREQEGADVALGVEQLPDKGFIIGGFTQSSEWASYVIRTDSLGIAQWSNIYPGSWQSECYDIQAVPDGGFIMAGTESSFDTDTDVMIMKLTSSGAVVWKKIYGSVDAEQGESVYQVSGGGYIVSGMSAHGAGSYDMYVIRTNSSGDSLWSKTIGGTGDDRSFAITSSGPGEYITAGWSWSYGQGMGDVYLAKLTEQVLPVELTSFTAASDRYNVILKWTTATEINNKGFEIQRKSDDTWQSIGFKEGSGTVSEYKEYIFVDRNISVNKDQTIKYRLKQVDMNGLFTYSNEAEVVVTGPLSYRLEQNYPNPFNPATSIGYSVAAESRVTLKLYDVLGNEIQTLLDEQKPQGNYIYRFTSGNLSSGTYIYVLEATPTGGNRVSYTKKMLLLK